MQGIRDVFPYLWQLNAQVNGLHEPTELTRDLIAGADTFLDFISQLNVDEQKYADKEVINTIHFLDETIEQLCTLRAKLAGSGLTGKENEQ